MTPELAKRFVETSINLGDEIMVREEYSGRRMYGVRTHAVVGNPQLLTEAKSWIAYHCGRDEDVDDDSEHIMNELTELRSDEMGRDVVWY